MIIKNITIENFRSYYGVNSIDIGEGLTLILGANGDGKTTFFEALEWLFNTTDTMPQMDHKYISKKKAKELLTSESAYVRVSMTYLNDGNERTIRKSFKFTKSLDGEVSPSNYAHELFTQHGVENDVKEGEYAKKLFDRDFAASIRKYSLFKGEQELNIFNQEGAMSYLIETFSQIRDFDPYISFMKKANDYAQKAEDNALKSDKKNSEKASSLRKLIINEEQKIADLENKLKISKEESKNFAKLIENQLQNRESAELLKEYEERLKYLGEQKETLQNELRENYTFRLLDEMWILMGFEPIADEFKEIVGKLDLEKRKLQSQHDEKKGEKKLVKRIQNDINNGIIPLAINVPDENTMREMLNDEVCKVCGRPAPKGSDPYIFMQARLEQYLSSLEDNEDEEEITPPLFERNYIGELVNQNAVLHTYRSFLSKINSFIDKAITDNIKKHKKIDDLSINIADAEEREKKLLAQANGMTKEQLLSTYVELNEWFNGRSDAERNTQMNQKLLDEHRIKLNELNEEYSKISEESSAAMIARTRRAISLIFKAFEQAKLTNKRDFLNQLEKTANEYLSVLNRGDFRGTAEIKPTVNNSAEIILVDVDGTRIHNPNTALKTTMYMSLLFAVSKLTTLKQENDYPMIFDAPTSSFTTAKESDFFGVIAQISKQTIIVTKSFLIEDEDGNNKLDLDRLKEIHAKKYRIEKKRPFDEKDLSTIQTIVEPIY